ncbi:MAG: ornithine cyclodeaminase family protein [Actinomycetota bacterium]|nr:ornithine cyclodeaminase family protein [Actinomycetota bacterium]
MPPVLLLSDGDVRSLLSPGEAVDAVEKGFLDFARGIAKMPAKLYLDFPEHSGDLRIMPASAGTEFAGVKLVNSHEHNPVRGLPAVVGTYVLFSQETGMPLCIMGATALTAVRTGAASGVACKYLARPESNILGLVGSGVQAAFQLRSIVSVLGLERVLVWAPERDAARRDSFIEEMAREFPQLDLVKAAQVGEAANADVVSTTTPSRAPLLHRDWVGPGTHINAVGADGPGKQELDPEILKVARVIVDEWHQALNGGEVNVPIRDGAIIESDIAGTLADVVSGRVSGRTSESEITVFDSTGLAIQDIAVATVVYQRALEQGLGSRIDL